MLDSNATPFILVKVNFIALCVIHILTILGYLAAVWKPHKSASLAMLGFTLVSLPVILVSQAFQLVMAKMLYTMTDIGDAFVALVLFDGLPISWALITLKKPHPGYYIWWILLLAVLPIGRFIGLPILGLANAALTGLLFVAVGIFMLRFAPRQTDPAQSS